MDIRPRRFGRLTTAGTLLLLVSCGGKEGSPFWAHQHGNLELSGDRIEGYHVWELYRKAWRKKQKEKHHLCSIVQELVGTEVEALDAWGSVVAAYDVSLTLQDSDCADEVAEDERYQTLSHVVVTNAPDADISDDDPYPGKSLGWSASFDRVDLEALGFMWNQELEADGGAVLTGWTHHESYVFWSAYAWELDEE